MHNHSTRQVNALVSNLKYPKGFGFGALDLAKSVATELGLKGLDAIKPIWKIAKEVLETVNPCQCEDRCYCGSCIHFGCTRCFSQIHRYIVNRMHR